VGDQPRTKSLAIERRAFGPHPVSLRSTTLPLRGRDKKEAPMPRVLASPIRAVVAGVLAANAMVSLAAAADKVAVGTGGSASDAPFYIAYDQGYFKDEGLDVDLIVLDSGAKVIAPLGTGELDVGSGALSVGFWNALARGIKFRIVADRGHAEPGYLYQTVFMRKDLIESGAFKGLRDLAGKRMGFAAQGVTSLSLLNEAAKFAGIRFEDVIPVYLSFPQQIAALQNKALDGSLLIEPQATIAVNAGYGVRFMDTNEFYPHQQISVIFYSEKFAKERMDVAQKFMRAWLRGVRTYNDALKDGKIAGDGADEVVATMARSLNMNPGLVREMYSQAVHVDGTVNTAGIQKDLDFFMQQGWVTGKVGAKDVIDTAFAQHASAVLGPYRSKRP
jgi:NitT/TauT family transport system substrate-binding protein